MTKNRVGIRVVRFSIFAVAGWLLFSGPLMAANSSVATMAVETPLKSSNVLLGGKTLQVLSPGTSVRVLKSQDAMTQIELIDSPDMKGWVRTAAITTSKDLTATISKSKSSMSSPNDTKTKIGSSIGGVAKGFASLSAKGGTTEKIAQTKSKSGSKSVTESQAGAESQEVQNSSVEALEKIESQKVTDAEIAEFMKQGGLKSRIIR
jgi:hypothetical protein